MCDQTDSKPKKSIKAMIQYGHPVRKDSSETVFTASLFPHVILCPNLLVLQASKKKLAYTHRELFTRIMTFKYEKMLLLNSPQNKVEKTEKQVRHIMYSRGILTYSH